MNDGIRRGNMLDINRNQQSMKGGDCHEKVI